jgi:hypothetical protein
MLAVPPLYTSARDAHAKLGGSPDQKHRKRKKNWLHAVNALHRMRIASREVDTKEAFGWSEASSAQVAPRPPATSHKAAASLGRRLAMGRKVIKRRSQSKGAQI